MTALTEESTRLAGKWRLVETPVLLAAGVLSTQLVAANPFRWAVEIALCGQAWGQILASRTNDRQWQAASPAVNLSLGGVVAAYVVPVGCLAVLTEADYFPSAAGATVNLEHVHGGVTMTVDSYTAATARVYNKPLLPNDRVQLNAVVAAAVTADLALSGTIWSEVGIVAATQTILAVTTAKRLTPEAPILRYNYRDDASLAQAAWFAGNLSLDQNVNLLVTETIMVQ